MGILSGYKEYKKFEPQYKDWKNQRNEQEAKREAYVKSAKNQITP